jgi:hypothetical protein
VICHFVSKGEEVKHGATLYLLFCLEEIGIRTYGYQKKVQEKDPQEGTDLREQD